MFDRSYYRDVRVLVTGASGFIGGHICTRLAESGAKVIGLVKEKSAPVISGVRRCTVDISRYEDVRDCLRQHRPEIIFNAAALVSGDRSIEIVEDFIDVNLVGAVNVMRAALETGRPRVVLCGSMEEAAEGSANETPYSAYAASKHASRLFGKLFYEQYELDVVMTRLFMVYGPGQLDTTKLIPYTISQLLSQETPEFTGGERHVDWIYIDDVVEALLALGARSDAGGYVFDIGSGQAETVRYVVEKIYNLTQTAARPQFGSLQDRGAETERVADWSPIHKLTGWKPKMSLEAGIRKTVAWYSDELVRDDRAT